MILHAKTVSTAALLLATLLWGSSFIALKWSFMYYDPWVVIFGRMIVASAGFLILYRHLDGNIYKKGDWRLLSLMALCEPCLYFILESMALQRTTASQAGMITALFPLMVAVGARIFLKEEIGRRTVAGFLLASAGVAMLSLSGRASDYAPDPRAGNTLELLAMISSTCYTLIMKRLSSRYNPLFLTAFQAFFGSMFFFPLLFLPSTRIPEEFHLVPALLIIYLGLFVTLAAYALFNFSVSRIPATQAIAFVNLTPVFAVILARLVLNETFNTLQYTASAVVLAGVFLSQRYDKPQRHGF